MQDELELEKNKKSKELTVDSILKFFHAHIKDLYKDKLLRAVVIDSFVKSILVYEDKVAVVLRYSDAPYSVTYEEIDARIKNRDKMLELYDSQNNSFFRFGVKSPKASCKAAILYEQEANRIANIKRVCKREAFANFKIPIYLKQIKKNSIIASDLNCVKL